MLRIKSPEDLAGSVLLLVLGAAGVVFASDLRVGAAARMGPGYFPILLSWCIIGCGVIVGLRAFTVEGHGMERPKLRPLLFVGAAILGFGFVIDSLGLAISAAAVTLVTAYAQPGRHHLETIILAVSMSAFVILVFVYALGQPVPVWFGH